tara:strand:+ start:2810 stop:3739 length:930 start_codon:yes stop_codon:yes gene_type:complete
VTVPSPDPSTKAILKDLSEVKELNVPGFELSDIRAAYDRVFAAWPAPSLKPTEESWVSLKALGNERRCLIVEPLTPDAERPSLVFIHGGGWSLGTALAYAPLARWLSVELNMRVLVPDFPQAPEEEAPAALNALSELLVWASERFKTKLILMGDSAGGNLTAVLSNHPPEGVEIGAQVLFYPVIDLRPDASYPSRKAYGKGKHFLTEPAIIGAGMQYCGRSTEPTSSLMTPLLETDFSKTPPTWHLLPEFDPLHDEGQAYAELLSQNGIRSEVIIAQRTIHGCASFAGRIPEADRCLKLICAQLNEEFS